MNQDQVLSGARSIVAILGGYAIGRGWITTDQLTLITGVVVAIIPLMLGIRANTNSAKMASVEAMPDVQKIVVYPSANGSVADAAHDPTRPKVSVGP